MAVALLAAACGRPPATNVPSPEMPAPLPSQPSSPSPQQTPPNREVAGRRECTWIAVVLDNSIPARPQSGVSLASVVYEFPTEGMITRLLAFFCEQAPQTVGPVRSLRTYMLEIAREYNAVVVHSGGSKSALAAVRSGAGPTINEFWQPKPFWRVRGRPRPHNLYTSIPALRPYLPKVAKAPIEHWETAPTSPAPQSVSIEIPYAVGYHVRFDYNPATNRYSRYVAGKEAIDAFTARPIEVSAILVQYARWWQTYEGTTLTSRLDLEGEGRIVLFAGGRRTEGYWKRKGPGRTQFTDLQGRPLQLPPGLVWVNIVPRTQRIKIHTP